MAFTLTPEQETFLEECADEFSDRFTDADLDYKKIYDLGVPTPPIMCPWQNKKRFNNRDRGGYNDRRYYDRRGEDSSYRRHEDRREYGQDNFRDRNSHNDRRYQPY